MKDMAIIKPETGEVLFDIYGTSPDSGVMLLQRLYTLLFSSIDDGYRHIDGSYTLLDFLEGGNQPPDAVMDSMLAICCATAVNSLDDDDRTQVDSFTGSCVDGTITCTLTLHDGTTLKGTLANG